MCTEGAPSHLEYHADSGVLYIADSGNGRVATLDTTGLPTLTVLSTARLLAEAIVRVHDERSVSVLFMR